MPGGSGSWHMPVLCWLAVKRAPGHRVKYTHPFAEAQRLSRPFVPLQTSSMSESQIVSTIIDDRDPTILYQPDASDWTVRADQTQLWGNSDTSR